MAGSYTIAKTLAEAHQPDEVPPRLRAGTIPGQRHANASTAAVRPYVPTSSPPPPPQPYSLDPQAAAGYYSTNLAQVPPGAFQVQLLAAQQAYGSGGTTPPQLYALNQPGGLHLVPYMTAASHAYYGAMPASSASSPPQAVFLAPPPSTSPPQALYYTTAPPPAAAMYAQAAPSPPGPSCPQCHSPYLEGSRFCSTCGQPLSPAGLGSSSTGGTGSASSRVSMALSTSSDASHSPRSAARQAPPARPREEDPDRTPMASPHRPSGQPAGFPQV
jgi:hypothetical protein